MSSIITNQSAMVALDTLKGINKNLSMVQNEISTGKSINTARDNAAIWSIATVMETDVASFEQISNSLNLGSATVGVARNAAESVTGYLQEAKDLIVSAQEENVDRSKIQTELNEIFAGINTTVASAQFNGQNLINEDGSISVLQSLDRSSNGSVSASNITVDKQNLSTADGRDLLLDSDDGYATVQTNLDNSEGRTLTLAGLTIADTTTEDTTNLSFDLGGESFSLDFAVDGATEQDIATAVANAINGNANLTAAGITAEINDANDAQVDFVIAAGADATLSNVSFTDFGDDDAVGGAGGDADTDLIGDVTVGTGLDNTNPRELTLEAVTIADIDAGDATGNVYTLNVGDKVVSYTALAGDDQDAIASGLVAAFATAGVTGVSAAVNGSNDNQIDFTVAGGTDATVVLQQTKTNAGETAGGLAGLDLIDVTVDPSDALSKIDGFLQTAIDAAAEFGSKQNRIDNQVDFVSSLTDSLKTGISTLTDANLEEASARLQALQVQQQLGVQALSIANQAPQALLGLFR